MPTIKQLSPDAQLQSTDRFLVDDSGGTKTAQIQQLLDLAAKNTEGIPDGRIYFVYDDTEYPSPLEVTGLDLYKFTPKNSTNIDDNIVATSANTLSVGQNVSTLIFGKDALAPEGHLLITTPDGDSHFSEVTSTDATGRTITLEEDFDDYTDFDSDHLGAVVVVYIGEVNLDSGGGETYTAGDGLNLDGTEFSVNDTVVRQDGSVTMNYLELDATTPYIEVGSNIALADLLDNSTDYPFEIDIHHNIPNLQEDGVYNRQGGGLYWITESDATDTSLKLWNEQVSRDRNDVTISRKSIIEHSPGEMTFYTNTSNVANDYDNSDRIIKVGPDTVEMFEGLDATVNGQRFIIRNEAASDNPLIDFISTNNSVVGGLRGYRTNTDFDRGSLVLHRHSSGDTYWNFDVWDGQNTAALRIGADDGDDAEVRSLVPFIADADVTLGNASSDNVTVTGTFYVDNQAHFRDTGAGAFTVDGQTRFTSEVTFGASDDEIGIDNFRDAGNSSILFSRGVIETGWNVAGGSTFSNQLYTGENFGDWASTGEYARKDYIITGLRGASAINLNSNNGWIMADVAEQIITKTEGSDTVGEVERLTELYGRRSNTDTNTGDVLHKTQIKQNSTDFVLSYNTDNDTDFATGDALLAVDGPDDRTTISTANIRFDQIGGTGNHLTISSSGDITRTTISGGGGSFSETDSYDLQGNNDFNWTGSAIAGSSTFYTAADDDLVIRNTGTDADTPTVSFLSSNNSLLGGFKLYRTSISDNTERGALLFHRESNGNTFARLQYFNTTYKNGLTIGETDRITSHVDHFFSGDINVTSGNNATFQGNISVTGTSALTGNVTLTNDLTVNGNTTLGNASTDNITLTGRIQNTIVQENPAGTISNQIISTMPNGGFDDNNEGNALTYILNTSAYDQGSETSVFNANFAQETWTTQHSTDAADLFFDREVRSLDRDSGHAVEGKSLFRQEHDQLTWWSKASSAAFADADRVLQVDTTEAEYFVPVVLPSYNGSSNYPDVSSGSIIVDSSDDTLRLRNAADDGWINVAASSINATDVADGVLGDGVLVGNTRSGVTSGLNFWHGTQAQYDAIETKDANTIYFTT